MWFNNFYCHYIIKTHDLINFLDFIYDPKLKHTYIYTYMHIYIVRDKFFNLKF